jgi:hypothetical protein
LQLCEFANLFATLSPLTAGKAYVILDVMSADLKFNDVEYRREVIAREEAQLRSAGYASWVDEINRSNDEGGPLVSLPSERFDGEPKLLAVAVDFASRRGVTLIVRPKPFHVHAD